MRAVNLLPRDEQRHEGRGGRAALLAIAGGLAAATAALGVLVHSASSTTADRRAALADVEAAIAKLPEPERPAVSQSVLAQERANRIAVLSSALRTRVPFDRLLRQVSLVLPEDAWLIGIAATAPVAAVDQAATPSAEAADQVTIQGATYSHDGVALVLARLSALPTLQNVRLGASTIVDAQPTGGTGQATRAGRAVVSFTIVASVGSRGGA